MYYDSSNKADYTDGKAQYGFVGMMMGGPIFWGSRKHSKLTTVTEHTGHNLGTVLGHYTNTYMYGRTQYVGMCMQVVGGVATPAMRISL